MPNVFGKRVVWLITGLQSILCLAFLSAWFVACFSTNVMLLDPGGGYGEDFAVFMVVMITAACIVMAMGIFKWNKKTNMALSGLLMAGVTAMSLMNLELRQGSNGSDGKYGITTFLDLPRWCLRTLFVLLTFAMTLMEPLIWLIMGAFLYAQVAIIVVMFGMTILTRRGRLSRGAG